MQGSEGMTKSSSGGQSGSQRLSWGLKLAYSSPAIALAVVGVPIFFYLPAFYTDVVGVDPVLFAVIFLASRMFDGIADPIMGAISDRTRTRWGRRRPFLVLGALPLALSVILVYSPPVMGSTASTIWLGATLFFLYAAWTCVIVPYEALGPELTFDYDERTRVLGLREAAYILGTILAVGTPILLDRWIPAGPDHERQKYLWFGLIYAPTIILTLVLCARVVRERAPVAAAQHFSFGSTLSLFKNRPFRILAVAFVVAALGNNLPAVLIPYYITYYLGSERIHEILLSYFVISVLFVPAWLWLSQRIGKKSAFIWAMVLNSAAFLPIYFLPAGAETAYWICVAISGTAGGAVVVIPPTMLADVIDYDELVSGARREGQYVGVWFIARKMAAAVGAGVGLLALGFAGYKANQAQPEHVLSTLRAFYVLVPVALNALSVALVLSFPIGRAEYARIRAAVAIRAAGGDALDPLA